MKPGPNSPPATPIRMRFGIRLSAILGRTGVFHVGCFRSIVAVELVVPYSPRSRIWLAKSECALFGEEKVPSVPSRTSQAETGAALNCKTGQGDEASGQ